MVKAHHAVAKLPFCHAAADGHYGASQFMSQDLRRRHISVKDLLGVGAANPTSSNFDEHFAVGDFGNGNFFDADDSLFTVDASTHGFRDRPQRLHSLQRCAGSTHRTATCSEGFATGN